MTEQEAETKRCCGPAGCGTHRKAANGKEYRGCTASACMAWRERSAGDWAEAFNAFMAAGLWIEAIKLYRTETGATLADAKHFVDAVRAGQKPRPTPRMDGYCGLAGRP